MTDTEENKKNEAEQIVGEQDTSQEDVLENEDASEQNTDHVEDEVTESEEEKLVRERAEYLDGWQRAQAEMVNLRKRHESDRKMFTTLGKESLLQELIPMLDNFDAAMSNKDAWEAVDANWRMGIEYIHSQFIQTLENNGVTAFGTEGDSFDAKLHEPVESEGEGTTVSQVMQKGYRMGDRIVRPAKVKLQ